MSRGGGGKRAIEGEYRTGRYLEILPQINKDKAECKKLKSSRIFFHDGLKECI